MFVINIKKSLLGKFSKDFLYTISAVIILNIVQQIFIQPYINATHGAAYLGDVLYYLGISYVFPQMFGTVLGHQRILYKHNETINNGDFLTLLGAYSLVVFAIGAGDAYLKTNDLLFALEIGIFMVICLLRYYAQVEFRLSLWFKGYLIYFLILSAGYIAGLGLFLLVKNWLVIFATGEIAAVLFVVMKGSVLHLQRPTTELKKLWLPTTILIVSYLLSSTAYLDRVLIQPILGSVAVSEYYAVSMVGKIMNMVLHPLSTLLLSYLADRKTSTINLSAFKKMLLWSIPVGAVLVALCCVATPIVVNILYPNLAESVHLLNLPINIGSVIGFASGLLLMFLLAETTITHQIIIRGLCFVVYISSTLYLTKTQGLLGYSYANIISNVFCVVCAVVCGVLFYKKKAKIVAMEEEAE